MMEKMAFICSCSECSLEGEAFLENERIRAEIREKEEKTEELEKKIAGLFGAALKRPLMDKPCICLKIAAFPGLQGRKPLHEFHDHTFLWVIHDP